MKDVTQITQDIFRLTIPYKDIYTTVCVVKAPEGAVLFDTGSYDSDADGYILPFLDELGITAQALRYIVISHNHTDHAGGLARLMQHFPETCIVSRHPAIAEKFGNYAILVPDDGDPLLSVLRIITVPGHTTDAVALLDTRSGTLLTGDSLQLYGIYGSGKWGANIGLPTEHLAAVEKLRGMDIDTIVASHDYHPWGYFAQGKDEIRQYLDACPEALFKIRDFLSSHPEQDPEEAAESYNASSGLPVVGSHIFKAIRTAIDTGNM